jgi:hypothetical protein
VALITLIYSIYCPAFFRLFFLHLNGAFHCLGCKFGDLF